MQSRTINNKETKPFPKLMKDDEIGTIVLFTEEAIGTVINIGSSEYSLGGRITACAMRYFEDLPEDVDVILNNKD